VKDLPKEAGNALYDAEATTRGEANVLKSIPSTIVADLQGTI